MIPFATQSRHDKSLLMVVQKYNQIAESTGSYLDYGYHMIITRADKDILEEELPRLVSEWGIVPGSLSYRIISFNLTYIDIVDQLQIVHDLRDNEIERF